MAGQGGVQLDWNSLEDSTVLQSFTPGRQGLVRTLQKARVTPCTVPGCWEATALPVDSLPAH